jgi:hypothetical protein
MSYMLYLMIEPRIFEKIIERFNCTGLWVDRTPYNKRHSCLYYRTGAHGAGLKSDIKNTVDKSPGTQ